MSQHRPRDLIVLHCTQHTVIAHRCHRISYVSSLHCLQDKFGPLHYNVNKLIGESGLSGHVLTLEPIKWGSDKILQCVIYYLDNICSKEGMTL